MEAQFEDTFGVRAFKQFVTSMFLPWAVLLSQYKPEFGKTVESVLELLGLKREIRHAILKPGSREYFIALGVCGLISASALILTIIYLIKPPDCVTMIEAFGPLLLYIGLSIMSGLYALNMDVKMETYHGKICKSLQMRSESLGQSMNTVVWNHYAQVLHEMTTEAKPQIPAWIRHQKLFIFGMPIPFIFLPFISRALSKCAHFQDWRRCIFSVGWKHA